MLNLKVETTRYTLRSIERAAQVQALATKKTRKPALVTGKRVYPPYGAQCSTATYVREYYLANAAVYVATDGKGKPYGETSQFDNFFKPMSTHVSVPQGVDFMETDYA
jgi:hypothetical protein